MFAHAPFWRASSLIQSASYPRSASNIVCGSNALRRIDEAEAVSLDRLPVGAKWRLVRILDADADLLGYLDGLGVALGDEIEVVNQEPFGGPFTVSIDGRKRSVGRLAAAALGVESLA